MKLELKHLAPYLPYKIKFIVPIHEFFHGAPYEMRSLTMEKDCNLCLDWGKPILRPLSDLNKEIVEGENGNTIYLDMFDDVDKNILELEDLHTYNDIFTISINAYNYLLENHFDVFNLIPNNLAININKL